MTALAPRTKRIAGLVGACALAIVGLSGCIKVDADITVNSDATGTGTFAFELQKEAAGFLGISDVEAFEAQMTTGDLAGDSGLGIFDGCETSESDTGFVYSCSFTDTAFTDPDEGPWTIVKDGDSVVFTMKSEGQADAAATDGADLLGDASMGTITVDVTFPGAITSITGEGAEQTSDTTATVSGSLTENISATITSETGGGGLSLSVLLVLLVLAAVLILIIVVVVVLISRRGKGAPTQTPDVDAAAATAAAPAAAAAVVVEETVTETVVEETITETVTDAAPVVEETITETVTDAAPVVEETITETVTDAAPVVEETITEAPQEDPPTA